MVAGKSGQHDAMKTTEQDWTVANAPTTKPRRSDRLVVSTKLKTSICRLNLAIYHSTVFYNCAMCLQLCITTNSYCSPDQSLSVFMLLVGWQEKHPVVKTRRSNTDLTIYGPSPSWNNYR